VYASLNQLTGSDEFPQIENVEQNFFPRNFYDARIRTSVPLINTDLHVNRRIVGQQVLLKEYEVEIYKRDLILQVKSSYYNYLSALAAVKIYESALQLVEKNHEINQALLNNGKSLPANVLRSKSEFEKVKAELNSARSKVAISRKYFNFLLNRDLTSEILVDDNITIRFCAKQGRAIDASLCLGNSKITIGFVPLIAAPEIERVCRRRFSG
jgi:hypothetical protein